MKDRILHMTQEGLCPQEQLCEICKNAESLCIGLPKEGYKKEKRFPLTPEAVAILTKAGIHVIIESQAGISINYSDLLYAESGAEITDEKAMVFQADIILKITPITVEEANLIKPGATVVSLFQPQYQNGEAIQVLLQKRIVAMAFDEITDEENHRIFADILDEIDGRAAMVTASYLLSNSSGGKGILMGGIPGIAPAEVVILGAGLAGRAAAISALGQGAMVRLFDNNVPRLRNASDLLGTHIFTSTLHPKVLKHALEAADVVIGTSCDTQFILPEEEIKKMKKGALLIDLCIGKGGCFETSNCPNSPQDKIFEKFGILHYCLSSIGSSVARTASMALSNLFLPILLDIADKNGIANKIKTDPGFRRAIYLLNGKVVNREIAQRFNLPFCDIALFIAIF